MHHNRTRNDDVSAKELIISKIKCETITKKQLYATFVFYGPIDSIEKLERQQTVVIRFCDARSVQNALYDMRKYCIIAGQEVRLSTRYNTGQQQSHHIDCIKQNQIIHQNNRKRFEYIPGGVIVESVRQNMSLENCKEEPGRHRAPYTPIDAISVSKILEPSTSNDLVLPIDSEIDKFYKLINQQ